MTIIERFNDAIGILSWNQKNLSSVLVTTKHIFTEQCPSAIDKDFLAPAG